MEQDKLKDCLRCYGKGSYPGTYGITSCGDCDGTGKVSVERRKAQLKARRKLLKEYKKQN